MGNIEKEGYEKSAPPELLICWRCGEVGHKKKDCTATLFCTNCGRYNHVTSKRRQPMKENCIYCKKGGHTEEYCPTKRLERFKQNQIKGFQSNYSELPRQQLTAGVPRLEDHEVLVLNQHQWKQKEIKREAMSRLALYREFGNQVHQKSVRLQDANIRSASVNSNSLEISRAMEKITETNQLMVQQQTEQQRALQALLMCQEHLNENQEITQGFQAQALRALTDVTEQRGFDSLFNRITKFDGKDPKKCHFWLNQVHVACMESGRNFRQVLIFCAKDTVLSVLSGLSPGLSDEEIKEEMMRCLSPVPTRRQTTEMMRTMC